MTTRVTKKKQSVSAYETTKEAVPVADVDFPSCYELSAEDDVLNMREFVHSLAVSSDLQTQIKVIQAKKGLLKQVLSSTNTMIVPEVCMRATVEALLQLYLRPCYFPVRGSLEWIVEVLTRVGSESSSDYMREVVTQVCTREWLALAQVDQLQKIKLSDREMNGLIGKILSINAMAVLDSQFRWLNDTKSSGEHSALEVFPLTDDGFLLKFCQYLAEVFVYCAARISFDTPDLQLSSSELFRYVECCGESMRALMTVLKSRRNAFVPATDVIEATGSSGWRKMSNDLLVASARVLQSEHANKDVITFTALCLLTVQRLLNAPGHDETAQLSAIMTLLSSEGQIMISEGHLHPTVAATMSTAPLMGKCAVVRACLAVFDDATLTAVTSQDGSKDSLMLGPVFVFIMQVCNHSMPLKRLYGLQTLEAWIARLLAVPSDLVLGAQRERLITNFRVVTNALTKAWSHPSRQVNHLVPNVYSKAVHAVHVLQMAASAPRSAASEGLWDVLLAEALDMPAHHRGRYQALNSLLPYMGAGRILSACSNIVHLLVSALGMRDIAAAVSGLLSSLLADLYASSVGEANQDRTQEQLLKLREIWSDAVLSALCHPTEYKLRLHTADYLLPELLKVDSLCVPSMIDAIRSRSENTTLHCKLWGMVSFTMQARLKGLSGQTISTTPTPGAGVTEQEFMLACIGADSELRLVALTALVASVRTAAPMDAADMRILRQTLRHSLKSADADHRHKVVRIVKSLFQRLKEACRAAERDLTKLEKQLQFLTTAKAVEGPAVASTVSTGASTASTVDATKKHKSRKLQQQQQAAMTAEDCVLAIATAKTVMQDSFDACQWLSQELLDNLYPGASCDREVMSLDLMSALIEAMGADSPQMGGVYSSHMIRTLLNLFISSWDRSRRMAADLLLQLPRPLTGYGTVESAGKLLEWGLELAGSAKLRESDAGALLVRDVYVVYAADLKWNLANNIVQQSPATTSTDVQTSELRCCGQFISALCDRWFSNLSTLEKVFSAYNMSALLSSNQQYPYRPITSGAETESSSAAAAQPPMNFPLCHGLLLAIRFCLMESQKAGAFEGAFETSESQKSLFWQPVIARIYEYALKSLKLAMTVVAEAPSDVPFAPVPISSKGPVNSASAGASSGGRSMAASYINTNSSMGSGEGGDLDESNAGATAQRAVVAAWLLVKESASLLALLVSLSPPTFASAASLGGALSDERSPAQLLTESEVGRAGSVILDALGRLKHMGAISEAQVALQSIATTLLRHGSKNPALCRLPRQWLDQVLGRLNGEQQQQVFILRRSAGFAYSFLSLLRAEPANCTPTLLHVTMQSLLQTVSLGLEDAQNFADGTVEDETECKWKLAVHALNVLRLILSDGTLGPDLNAYIPDTAQLAVRGFTAPQWAVRNSCMMVFTAVAQRAVGTDKNDSSGAAVPTITEFFQRFPALEPFLVSELTVATAPIDGSVHPTLYPLMLLIAKLRVAVMEDSNVPSTDSFVGTPTSSATIAQLVQLVGRCSGQKVQAVRVIAAKALRVLTPVSGSPAAAADLIDNARALLENGHKQRTDLNALHGRVLAARELLRSTCTYTEANASTNEEYVAALRQQTVEQVLPVLNALVDTASELQCAAVHIALLDAVRAVQLIVKGGTQTTVENADRLLIQVCRQSLPAIYFAGLGSPAVRILPFEPWLWRECMHSMVHLSLSHTVSPALQAHCLPAEMVAELLNHRISEVREGTLRGLLDYLRGQQLGQEKSLSDGLMRQLLQRVGEEREPPVSQLAMQVFTCIIAHGPLCAHSSEVRTMFHQQGSRIFDALTCSTADAASTAAENAKSPSLKQNSSAQAALEISGWIIADRLSSSSDATSLDEEDVAWLHRWVRVLEAASPDVQSVALRISAARSLQHSGLLATQHSDKLNVALAAVRLRAGLVALTLLQDDDEDVREVVSALLIPATAGVHRGSAEVPTDFATTEEFSLHALSMIIGECLCACPSNQAALWAALQNCILGKENERCAIADLICSDRAALSQKIFEAEQDNLYLEHVSAGRVLIAALTLASRGGYTVLEDLAVHCTTAIQQLKALLGDAAGQSTYQPVLFRYFYLSLLLARSLVDIASTGQQQAAAGLDGLRVALIACSEATGTADRARVHPWIAGELQSLV